MNMVYDRDVTDLPDREVKSVRETLAANVKRIRTLRDMTGREFIARLGEQGVKLLPSGLTAMEKGERRLTVEELLAVAIVLNTSIVDLLMPGDGHALAPADGTEPLDATWSEMWLQGVTPLPNLHSDPEGADFQAFLDTASEHRKALLRRDQTSEIVAIDGLRSRVRQVIEAIEDPTVRQASEDPESFDFMRPEAAAALLREQLAEVDAYVDLLAKRVEKNGYGTPGKSRHGG